MESIYRFGEFRLDPVRHELWRGSTEVALPRKVFACIVYLIQHRDRVVGREELMQSIWGHVHLTDSTLGQAIRRARLVLEDNGHEQQIIKTVRDFGYRWAAEIEAPDEIRSAPRNAGEGRIALLLPVTMEVDSNGEHAWIRLGVMDLIVRHLRGAGQPMVRSDTVIALMQGFANPPRMVDIEQLARETGAQLVLSSRAQVAGARWRIALHSVLGASSPLNTLGEAHDVMEAARIAADNMILSLGLKPGSDLDVEPRLAMLLRKTEAAMLAQQMEAARELIESADADLRSQPEVRLQLGWIAYESHQLNTAQTVFEFLLADTPADTAPVLRARVLHGLGGVYFRRGQHRRARAILEEALLLHGDEDPRGTRGRIQRLLGFVTLIGSDFERARVDLAASRKSFEASGDVRGLDALDNNLGVLAMLRDRPAQALFHFQSATSRQAALYDVDAELRNHANAVEAHLALLDPQAALSLDPRIRELLGQTRNARTIVHAKLARALLLDANGKSQAASDLLRQVLAAVGGIESPALCTGAFAFAAERLMRDGAGSEALRIAERLIGDVPPDHEARQDDGLGRAWLIAIRRHLDQGNVDAAEHLESALSKWARNKRTHSPAMHAALARACRLAVLGQHDDAQTAFERALEVAESRYAPLRTLQVVEIYVPWMLARGPLDSTMRDRALSVADRISPYADRDYTAALLQSRVYLALGPRSASRAARARAQSLAGERPFPADLQVSPAFSSG
ncbi:MAG TPA: winged helix-turn-helix domain-containing protein [Rhodanobacteraceae bacterium]|nr:winged helix-turn-helix domain-containing protein [Rhodanobacteraceae bacterium]